MPLCVPPPVCVYQSVFVCVFVSLYLPACLSDRMSVCTCLATLVLVSSGQVDTGQWSVSDDVIEGSDVHFVPVFLPTPRNVTVSLGDRAVLRCRVDNLNTRTVRHL